VSALIGMALGYEDWFIPKTPLNLMIGFVLLVWNTAFDSWKVILGFAIAFIVGMTMEILGVSTGKIFGNYAYGANLGSKLLDVPYMIGLYWVVLVVITSFIARKFSNSLILVSSIGAGLMVILDLFIEQMAPRFDFWKFEQHPVPLENYIAWFVIAFILHICVKHLVTQSSSRFSLHLYLSQLSFFAGSLFLLQ
jgi:putative membrane protein